MFNSTKEDPERSRICHYKLDKGPGDAQATAWKEVLFKIKIRTLQIAEGNEAVQEQLQD